MPPSSAKALSSHLVEITPEHGFILDSSLTDNFIVRIEIYDMLVKARSFLPHGLNLKIGELYRTLAKQRRMWHEVFDKIAAENKTLSAEEITERTEKWIANPYTHGSGHQSGAAVDVTISAVDSNGQELNELDMGTRMQEFNDKTVTNCSSLTKEQVTNRALLVEVMTKAGFVNYPEEWWHYSYGDRLWAELTNSSTVLFTTLDEREIGVTE